MRSADCEQAMRGVVAITLPAALHQVRPVRRRRAPRALDVALHSLRLQ